MFAATTLFQRERICCGTDTIARYWGWILPAMVIVHLRLTRLGGIRSVSSGFRWLIFHRWSVWSKRRLCRLLPLVVAVAMTVTVVATVMVVVMMTVLTVRVAVMCARVLNLVRAMGKPAERDAGVAVPA